MTRRQMSVVCMAALLVTICAALVLATAIERAPVGTRAAQSRVTQSPPSVVTPTVPVLAISAKPSVWRINKAAAGTRTLEFGEPYDTDTGQTVSATTHIRLQIGSAVTSDENLPALPGGSILEATGTTSRRADGLGVFTGTFTIKTPANVTLFTGTMQLLDRVGSHQPPLGSETAIQTSHQEGWLDGTGEGPCAGFLLHAAVASRGALPTTSGTVAFQPPIRIVGVLVK